MRIANGTTLVLALALNQVYGGLHCIVCKSPQLTHQDDEHFRRLFGDPDSIPDCRQGDLSQQNVTRKCPHFSNKSCITKAYESSVMRSCSPLALNSCENFFGITYCYCRQNGCNDLSRDQSRNVTFPSDSIQEELDTFFKQSGTDIHEMFLNHLNQEDKDNGTKLPGDLDGNAGNNGNDFQTGVNHASYTFIQNYFFWISCLIFPFISEIKF